MVSFQHLFIPYSAWEFDGDIFEINEIVIAFLREPIILRIY